MLTHSSLFIIKIYRNNLVHVILHQLYCVFILFIKQPYITNTLTSSLKTVKNSHGSKHEQVFHYLRFSSTRVLQLTVYNSMHKGIYVSITSKISTTFLITLQCFRKLKDIHFSIVGIYTLHKIHMA